jgi:hypothetical protein
MAPQTAMFVEDLISLRLAALGRARPISAGVALNALNRDANPCQSCRDNRVADGGQHSSNQSRKHRPTPQCSRRYVRSPAPHRKCGGRLFAPIAELFATANAAALTGAGASLVWL